MKKVVLLLSVILLLASCAVLPYPEITPPKDEGGISAALGKEPEQSELDSAAQSPADETEGLFSAEKMQKIINNLEDHYADMFKDDTAREWLDMDIIKIEQVNDLVYIYYDFYGVGEGWSLRIGTVIVGKNEDGEPYIISDEIDEAAMEKVEECMRAWGGLQEKTEDNSTSPSADTVLSTKISANKLAGYWADIAPGFDGIDHLNGFFFAEDGTGLVFHSAEGAFLITAYSYSDSGLTICFLNMEDNPVESYYQIHSISENEMEISFGADDSDTISTYDRMLMIAPYNCMGGYTVTQMDGLVFDVGGY